MFTTYRQARHQDVKLSGSLVSPGDSKKKKNEKNHVVFPSRVRVKVNFREMTNFLRLVFGFFPGRTCRGASGHRVNTVISYKLGCNLPRRVACTFRGTFYFDFVKFNANFIMTVKTPLRAMWLHSASI